MRSLPLNHTNSAGLFKDTTVGKVQKWVVLIECVGWVISFFNCSLRNWSPIGALSCGLLCYPGHGWQCVLRAPQEQLSQQGSSATFNIYQCFQINQSFLPKRMHTDKHVLFYINMIKSCAFLHNMQINFLMQHNVSLFHPRDVMENVFVVNCSVQGVLFATVVLFQL